MSGEGRFIGGVVLGLGLAYILDPDRGSRRRAIARDKATHVGRKLAERAEASARDLKNRASGTAAELRSRLRQEDVSDEILHERVRSAIGRVVSHPSAVTVSVIQGRLTLTGPVLEDEIEALIGTASQVRGVHEVVNELEVHPTADGVPALQGGTRGTNGGR
jgi:osmotically-inducible protein OsmY